MSIINKTHTKLRKVKKDIRFFLSINWIKTIYFNFKMFPYEIAKKLPVFFYGKVKFHSLNGTIFIDAEIQTAMIGFGQPYEMIKNKNLTSEFSLEGKLIFKGYVQFGKGYFVCVQKDAILEMGHMSSLASKGKIICTKNIVFGNYTRMGSESQVIDTNFHQMINTLTGEKYEMSNSIILGNYNFISNRVTIIGKTKTPDNCTIASNSLCTKDYTELGENILIGGIPSKLIKNNISRDWEAEKESLDMWLKIKF